MNFKKRAIFNHYLKPFLSGFVSIFTSILSQKLFLNNSDKAVGQHLVAASKDINSTIKKQ
jgi:hypothetical protein